MNLYSLLYIILKKSTQHKSTKLKLYTFYKKIEEYFHDLGVDEALTIKKR